MNPAHLEEELRAVAQSHGLGRDQVHMAAVSAATPDGWQEPGVHYSTPVDPAWVSAIGTLIQSVIGLISLILMQRANSQQRRQIRAELARGDENAALRLACEAVPPAAQQTVIADVRAFLTVYRVTLGESRLGPSSMDDAVLDATARRLYLEQTGHSDFDGLLPEQRQPWLRQAAVAIVNTRYPIPGVLDRGLLSTGGPPD
jgi:hypothetical protein